MAEAAAAAAFAKNAAIFMGKTAAGAAISYLVNKALGRLSAEEEDLHRSLKEKLPVIQAIFDVGDHELVRERLGDWFWIFRDAMQEAEDALDELEFLDLEKEVKDRRLREAKNWKVSLSSRFSFSHIGTGVRRSVSAATTGGTPKRLKDALKGLHSVLENAGDFLSVIMNVRSSSSDIQDLGNTRETTRELTTTVFGRHKEKGELLEWLGVHTSADIVDHKLSLCAIVGGGGMGKTTLAQSICQDKNVQDHFGNMIIWVHVSKRFDPRVLMSKIMESINPDKSRAMALDSLQSDLIKQLVTKRFFLVLDDAWEDAKGIKWKEFLGPLRNNAAMGGRILLTTRMRSVAEAIRLQMQVEVKCLELRGLGHEDTLKLFNHHAFGDSYPNDRLDLLRIAEQIVGKLKGCPFIAEVLGQQLRDNTDLSRWNMILNQDIYQYDEIGPAIKEMLKRSYQNLSYELQLCFRYCSIFPPGFKFKMEELTEMWVGSGLILQQENAIKNQEDTAREHFCNLARKSFFSLVPRELLADPSEDYYVMHDLMYDLACTVSSEECLRFTDGGHSADIHCIPKLRHLYIQSLNSEIITIISQSKNLRTLIIENGANSVQKELAHDLKKAIKGRTSLRLLKLDGHGLIGLNDAAAELKHLRYIYMSAIDEPNLCKLLKLYHLQVLRITKIDEENKEKSIDIGYLPCVQKLYLPKNTLSRISHIGRLTTLRELNGFSVRKKDGHRITELQDLGKLRKIIVLDVQNVSNFNEAYAARLDNKTALKVLSLGWSDDHGRDDVQILTKLVPNRSLKNLIISGYIGIKPPIWMEPSYLTNLVYLKLDGCVQWHELPLLGTLRSLKHVFLLHLTKLKCIASLSNGSGGLPPHLVTFDVKYCPDLSELPVLPFSLKFLGVEAVGISSLPTTMSDLERLIEPQLSVLQIESCEFLASLDGSFLQEEHYNALSVLKLFRCHKLSSLPDAAHFQRMCVLESVEIVDCDILASLGGLVALSHLKLLKIERCGNLLNTSSSRLPQSQDESLSLELETLAIDDHLLLVLTPLRNLCCTRRLIISGESITNLLPEDWLLQNGLHLEHIQISNAEHLQSLPLKMHDLHALRSLLLHNAPLLQSLPVMPPQLWAFIITGCCTELNEQCLAGGSEWTKISHIHRCNISNGR